MVMQSCNPDGTSWATLHEAEFSVLWEALPGGTSCTPMDVGTDAALAYKSCGDQEVLVSAGAAIPVEPSACEKGSHAAHDEHEDKDTRGRPR